MENNALGCFPTTCVNIFGDDLMRGGGMGGGTVGGAAGAGLGAIIAGMFGDDEKQGQPNVGKDLSDTDKAELGGTGSGTPPPPENDPNYQDEKPVEKLNQKQESSIKKIDNAIKNALKDHDIIGTLKGMDSNPVPKENGGHWDHMQKMKNTLRGLRNHAGTLKNVNNPEAQAAYGRATENRISLESALTQQ